MIGAVRNFLGVVLDEAAPNIGKLARALDELAFACHYVPAGRCSLAKAEPPRPAFGAVRRSIEARFPQLGTYAAADPLDGAYPGLFMGDAVDDLTDIALEMREVAWRWDALGPDDAAWHFRVTHPHWGRRLRGLCTYLFAKQFDAIP